MNIKRVQHLMRRGWRWVDTDDMKMSYCTLYWVPKYIYKNILQNVKNCNIIKELFFFYDTLIMKSLKILILKPKCIILFQ